MFFCLVFSNCWDDLGFVPSSKSESFVFCRFPRLYLTQKVLWECCTSWSLSLSNKTWWENCFQLVHESFCHVLITTVLRKRETWTCWTVSTFCDCFYPDKRPGDPSVTVDGPGPGQTPSYRVTVTHGYLSSQLGHHHNHPLWWQLGHHHYHYHYHHHWHHCFNTPYLHLLFITGDGIVPVSGALVVFQSLIILIPWSQVTTVNKASDWPMYCWSLWLVSCEHNVYNARCDSSWSWLPGINDWEIRLERNWLHGALGRTILIVSQRPVVAGENCITITMLWWHRWNVLCGGDGDMCHPACFLTLCAD